MKKIGREAARIAGLKYYFTGKPCVNGHVAQRRVDNWACMECARAAARDNYHKRTNPSAMVTLRLQVKAQHVELVKQIINDINNGD